jgi:hypothetical protein
MGEKAIDFVLSKISLSTGTRAQSNRVATHYEIPRAVVAEAIINAVATGNTRAREVFRFQCLKIVLRFKILATLGYCI